MTSKGNTPPGRIDFSRDWDFTYTPAFAPGDMPRTFAGRMPVPGIWDDHLDLLRQHDFYTTAVWNPTYKPIVDFPFPTDQKSPGDASLPYLHGTGWYRQSFSADASDDEARYVLNLGPARMEAHVWVNRKLMAHHKSHATPCRLDITDAVARQAENEVVIAVTNTCDDRFGCDTRGYKGQSGGIMGATWIDVVGAACIDDLYVREDDQGKLCWQVSLGGDLGADSSLRWVVSDHNGTIIHQGSHLAEDRLPTWTSDSTGLKHWSETDPALYTITVTLACEGRTLDCREQTFGLRRIKGKGTGLLLNNVPLYLRGGTEHCYFPESCTPPIDKAACVERLQAWQRLGINWLRCHTWTPGESFFTAADEAGMLIQVEPARGYSLEEWAAIIRTCRKHPSVILYCCGNEEWLTDEKIDYLEECQKRLAELAPDALFNPQEALRGVEYGWDMAQATEAEVAATIHEPVQHHPARLARLREFCDVFGNYPWGKFSYSSCYGDLARLNEQMSIYQRPLLAHEIGILGTYIDLSLEARYQGTRIGTELYAKVRAHLAAAGVLEQAPIYFRNSCRQMYALVKDLLESARLCACLAGYDWLAPSDHHWHRSGYHCGVLNEFQEAKWEEGIGDIVTANAQSVLLLDHGRTFNLTSGQQISLPLILSLYAPQPLDRAELTWRLVNEAGDSLAQGSWTNRDIANGANTELGCIAWALHTDTPQALTLQVELQAESLTLANRWRFWIFPEVKDEPVAADLQVVKTLTPESVDSLENGARIVLLGPGPFPAAETRFQPAIAGRQFGVAATVIHPHPALGDFPHDGFCDWQFKPMRDGSHNVVFNELKLPSDPIIDVASSYKHVVKAATLFEVCVGAGKLLVCSFNFAADDPAAAYLKSQLVRYAGSDHVAPRTHLPADTLRRLIQESRGALAEAETDMAADPNATRRSPA